MDWAAYYPDMNNLESIGDMLGSRIGSCSPTPEIFKQLKSSQQLEGSGRKYFNPSLITW